MTRTWIRITLVFLTSLLSGTSFLFVASAHGQGDLRQRANSRRLNRRAVASARLEWSVPPRLEQSWAAWTGRSYDLDYLYPSSWPVMLDLCASSGAGEPIEEYRVLVEGVGFGFRESSTASDCTQRIEVPRLGRYRLTATVRTREGWSRPHTETLEVKDWLVVNIGDSMSSGEGNPDQPGEYEVDTVDHDLDTFEVEEELRPVGWKDERCHRSALAGPVLAAKALEASDPHSSVTLVDLACSGAQILTGLLESYKGMEPPDMEGRVRDHRDLPPQVELLERLVGPGSERGGRRIDALLMSIGVNDLGFSSIARACAKNYYFVDNCVGEFRSMVTERMEELPARYARLADRLRRGLDISEVYIAAYPANAVKGGGCGDLGVPGLGIDGVEGSWIYSVGSGLNARIRHAAEQHGWNFVGGMTEAFHNHTYCDSPTYFVGHTESFETQGNEDGTLHPNRRGHEEYRDLLLDAIVLGPQTPHKRVTVTITHVKVARGSASARVVDAGAGMNAAPLARPVAERDERVIAARAPTRSPTRLPRNERIARPEDPRPTHPLPPAKSTRVGITLPEYQNDLPPHRHVTVSDSLYGEWVSVPPDEFTWTLELYPEPASPRHPVAVSVTAVDGTHQVNGFFTAEDGFGEGTHEATHPTGNLSIRYRIQVEDILPRFAPQKAKMKARMPR